MSIKSEHYRLCRKNITDGNMISAKSIHIRLQKTKKVSIYVYFSLLR
jgi:hypothetical protein